MMRCISVSTTPGRTLFTRMPVPSNSAASTRVKWYNPALAAQYALHEVITWWAAPLLTLTITPRFCSTM